jgi:aspartyl protease family protein
VVVVNDTTMRAMILALMLILPLSALVARRMPLSRTVMLVLIWVAIFGVAYGIIALFT